MKVQIDLEGIAAYEAVIPIGMKVSGDRFPGYSLRSTRG